MLRIMLAAVACTVALSFAAHAEQPGANEDAQIVAALDKRLKEYAALHDKLHSTLPPLSTDATAAEIDKNQRALGALVQKARRHAERGDIFGPVARAMIRRILARALTGPDGPKLRDSIMDDNPGPLKIRVNSRYPDAAPRSSVPPQILQLLPKLPEDLDYRFIGDRLLLVDLHAQIVVDFIENALPS
jgi:hypothetical protein